MTALMQMSVLTRPTSRGRLRRHRGDRPAEDIQVFDRRPSAAPSARRGEVDPVLDRATYGCACGLQFAATVTTSVVCPHCGDTQAW